MIAMKQQSELLNVQKAQGMASVLNTIEDTKIKGKEGTKSEIYNRYLKKVDDVLKSFETNSAKKWDEWKSAREKEMKHLYNEWDNAQINNTPY
jgi:hypothetical protein